MFPFKIEPVAEYYTHTVAAPWNRRARVIKDGHVIPMTWGFLTDIILKLFSFFHKHCLI